MDEAPVTVSVYTPAGVPVRGSGGPVDVLAEPPPQDQSPSAKQRKMIKARTLRRLGEEPTNQAAAIRTETNKHIAILPPKNMRRFCGFEVNDELPWAVVWTVTVTNWGFPVIDNEF